MTATALLADLDALRLAIQRMQALEAHAISVHAHPSAYRPAITLREATPALLDWLDAQQIPIVDLGADELHAEIDGCRVYWPRRRSGAGAR